MPTTARKIVEMDACFAPSCATAGGVNAKKTISKQNIVTKKQSRFVCVMIVISIERLSVGKFHHDPSIVRRPLKMIRS
jgi:hypothetical protein